MDNKEELKPFSKEIQIMRQSQNKLVVEYVRDLGLTLTVEEINYVTDVFVETCSLPMKGIIKQRVKDLDAWLKKKVEEKKGMITG